LPAAILLMLKLRDMAGLSNPALTHPLFATPIAFPAKISVAEASDPLLSRVHTRLQQNGFRETAIIHAITTQTPLVVDASVGTMPLRPDLYSPTSYIEIRPVADNERRKKEQRADSFTNGLASLLAWLPCLLTCLLLISVEKETLAKLFHSALDLQLFTKLLLSSWISLPYILLGWAMLKFPRHFINDSQLLVATLMLYFFEEVTYGYHYVGSSPLENVSVFLWVPLAQIVWVCGWLYTIAKKNPEILVWQHILSSNSIFSNVLFVLVFAFILYGYWNPKNSAHQAACEESFNTNTSIVAAREKAMTDGYEIYNYQFECIDKAAYIAMNEDKVKREAQKRAYNSPEAIAKRKQEADKRMAEQKLWQEEASRKETKEEAQKQARMAAIIANGLSKVDVNTATEAELAQVISLKNSPDVVTQIISERNKRLFDGWPDLVHRVVGLSAAQTAVYASICGLNVKGESLEGAPPNAEYAAMLNEKLLQRR
jgi:DNA uptake protein ComE-like DNA-binding protein